MWNTHGDIELLGLHLSLLFSRCPRHQRDSLKCQSFRKVSIELLDSNSLFWCFLQVMKRHRFIGGGSSGGFPITDSRTGLCKFHDAGNISPTCMLQTTQPTRPPYFTAFLAPCFWLLVKVPSPPEVFGFYQRLSLGKETLCLWWPVEISDLCIVPSKLFGRSAMDLNLLLSEVP